MLKRSRLEVYFDVLKAIGEGVDKPTRIMYKANLSWNTLEDALATLVNREFVQNALEHFNKALENLSTPTNLIVIRR